MSTRDEIAAAARERIGGSAAWMAFREYGVLARMLAPDERIEAMALGRLRGHGLVGAQRLVVATPRRLLLVEKGLLTGRERTRELPWEAVRDVIARPPSRLDVALDGERIALHMLQPPRQVAAIGEAFRARATTGERTAPSVDELAALGRRKLGRVMAYGAEPHLLTLAGVLGPHENVLGLGFADGLLAATTERLLFLRTKGTGVGETVALPYADIRRAAVTERQGVAVSAAGGDLELDTLVPAGSAEAIVGLVRARAGRPGA